MLFRSFPAWDAAVHAAREISQGEFGMPSVFRISDPEETDVALKLYGIEGTVLDRLITFKGFKPGKRSLMIGMTDGEKNFAANIKKQVREICRSRGAFYLTGYPVKNWEKGRYSDPYMREDLNDFGIIIDTLETGVTWENLHNLHSNVRSFIKSRPNTICMTHASHFYPQGTNLYFIFIAKMSDAESEAAETQVWLEFATKCNYMQVSIASELESTYDQIIGQIVKMIEEADKWTIKKHRHGDGEKQ